MDQIDKLKIYMDYFINYLYFKHGKKFEYLNPPIFEDFCKESNYEVIDMGENWKGNLYGERYHIKLYGIYRWLYIHSELIKK